MSDFIVTQDLSSERVHRRVRNGKGYASHEADNLDQAGPYRVLSSSQLSSIPEEAFCKRCFPANDPAGVILDNELEDDGSTQSDVSEA